MLFSVTPGSLWSKIAYLKISLSVTLSSDQSYDHRSSLHQVAKASSHSTEFKLVQIPLITEETPGAQSNRGPDRVL